MLNDADRPARAGTLRTRVIALAAMAVVAAACEKPRRRRRRRPEVYVAAVVQRDVPVYLELVGQTEGLSGRRDPRARRRLPRDVNFTEGAFVRKGDLLYEIDRKPLEAALSAREGRPGDRGGAARQGQQRRRAVHAARRQAGRQPAGARRRASAQEAAQRAGRGRQGRRRQGDAGSRLHARHLADRAGSIGTTQVKAGNLVGRGETTLLTTISQIDPIIFRVGVTEADYLRVAQARPGRVAARRARSSGIELTLADGTVYPAHGQGRLDRARGGCRPPARSACSSIFPNPESLLRPGQYGRRASLLETKTRRAARAAARGAGAAEPVQRRRRRRRTTRSRSATSRSARASTALWVIEEGLKPGEKVVVEGLQRIQDGMTVRRQAGAACGARYAGRRRERGEVSHGALLRQPADRRDGDLDHHGAARRRRDEGLPIAQYPEIVPPMIQVTTTFIGASATDVEASVATPLEQQINGVEKMHLHEVHQRQRRHA